MHQKWDERYQEPGFAYGKTPNVFFAAWLPRFKPGAILMPADGEGRNGVFAAQLGWQVTACDLSIEGQSKALQLAAEKGVTLEYQVGDMEQLHFENASFDAMALIYAHFPGDRKSAIHRQLDNYIKPGGILIFEAFSKQHLDYVLRNPAVGGPRDIATLFSKEELLADFNNYEVLLLEDVAIDLQEGKYHNGQGSVIRFVGRRRAQ
jgi:SAM-dependent methyltransferase